MCLEFLSNDEKETVKKAFPHLFLLVDQQEVSCNDLRQQLEKDASQVASVVQGCSFLRKLFDNDQQYYRVVKQVSFVLPKATLLQELRIRLIDSPGFGPRFVSNINSLEELLKERQHSQQQFLDQFSTRLSVGSKQDEEVIGPGLTRMDISGSFIHEVNDQKQWQTVIQSLERCVNNERERMCKEMEFEVWGTICGAASFLLSQVEILSNPQKKNYKDIKSVLKKLLLHYMESPLPEPRIQQNHELYIPNRVPKDWQDAVQMKIVQEGDFVVTNNIERKTLSKLVLKELPPPLPITSEHDYEITITFKRNSSSNNMQDNDDVQATISTLPSIPNVFKKLLSVEELKMNTARVAPIFYIVPLDDHLNDHVLRSCSVLQHFASNTDNHNGDRDSTTTCNRDGYYFFLICPNKIWTTFKSKYIQHLKTLFVPILIDTNDTSSTMTHGILLSATILCAVKLQLSVIHIIERNIPKIYEIDNTKEYKPCALGRALNFQELILSQAISIDFDNLENIYRDIRHRAAVKLCLPVQRVFGEFFEQECKKTVEFVQDVRIQLQEIDEACKMNFKKEFMDTISSSNIGKVGMWNGLTSIWGNQKSISCAENFAVALQHSPISTYYIPAFTKTDGIILPVSDEVIFNQSDGHDHENKTIQAIYRGQDTEMTSLKAAMLQHGVGSLLQKAFIYKNKEDDVVENVDERAEEVEEANETGDESLIPSSPKKRKQAPSVSSQRRKK
ncbi:hypothetical protein C9374_011465 [Naegleria lovaniensis]|uniref:Uncharacterized protein n=1 Tax=Naegleria lovaniensis TaxID=51637 RepID=A0AA88KWR2_NAELO|nr:uncharacterized protein C9374_011465 [Naegleria lovaniensis]KAG2392740.1 hypothetical protein C9374_011465 [Naegleria lovaniensis]